MTELTRSLLTAVALLLCVQAPTRCVAESLPEALAKADSSTTDLDLKSTAVTDAGLEYLKGLSALRWLYLDNTKITDAGLEHLKGLTALELLSLEHTQITDAGLEHLKGLPTLRSLLLHNTRVTEAGKADFRAARPDVTIYE